MTAANLKLDVETETLMWTNVIFQSILWCIDYNDMKVGMIVWCGESPRCESEKCLFLYLYYRDKRI